MSQFSEDRRAEAQVLGGRRTHRAETTMQERSSVTPGTIALWYLFKYDKMTDSLFILSTVRVHQLLSFVDIAHQF